MGGAGEDPPQRLWDSARDRDPADDIGRPPRVALPGLAALARELPRCARALRGLERPKPPEGGFVNKDRRRPTLPGGCPPSTIGAEGLNGSVRNGKRCFPLAMATEIVRDRPAPARLENCTQAKREK